jgi:hypothetical protein
LPDSPRIRFSGWMMRHDRLTFFMGGSFTQDRRFVKYNEKFADFQKNPA